MKENIYRKTVRILFKIKNSITFKRNFYSRIKKILYDIKENIDKNGIYYVINSGTKIIFDLNQLWLNKKSIHCIGDSHAGFFEGQYKFIVHRFDSVLAYNLCKFNTRYKGRERLFHVLSNIPAGSRVMFCFGEIDCRAHIIKQAELQKRTVDDIAKECVNRYFSVIKKIKEAGFKVLVLNVMPSALDTVKIDPDVPRYGTCIERNNATRIFNNYLKIKSVEENIHFIDVFDKFIKDGITKGVYYKQDGVHLSQKAMPFVLEVFKTLREI